MSMFAKLFSRITESSLMEEPIETRYVFVMLLAIADQNGYVVGTDVAIARRLNVPLQTFKEALERLMAPDPSSNSKEHDGRRVLASDLERGYFIVNYEKYRSIKSREENNAYMREYMAKRRAAVKGVLNPVKSGKADLSELGHAEEEAERESEVEGKENNTVTRQAAGVGFSLEPEQGKLTKKEKRERFKPPTFEEAQDYGKEIGLTDAQAAYVFEHYKGNGWKAGKVPMSDWKSCWRKARLGWDFGQVNEKAKETQYDVTPEQMAEWTQNRIDREREREERAAAKARGETWEEKNDF